MFWGSCVAWWSGPLSQPSSSLVWSLGDLPDLPGQGVSPLCRGASLGPSASHRPTWQVFTAALTASDLLWLWFLSRLLLFPPGDSLCSLLRCPPTRDLTTLLRITEGPSSLLPGPGPGWSCPPQPLLTAGAPYRLLVRVVSTQSSCRWQGPFYCLHCSPGDMPVALPSRTSRRVSLEDRTAGSSHPGFAAPSPTLLGW